MEKNKLNRGEQYHLDCFIEKLQAMSDYLQRNCGVDPDLSYKLIAIYYLYDIADNTDQLNCLTVTVDNVIE